MSLALAGCTLAPAGAEGEAAKLKEAGRPYDKPVGERALPDLSERPSWREVLRLALLNNGDLEAFYFEWRAAAAKIDQAAAYPNGNVQLGFEYMFSDERMKSWDRTTLTAGLDPAMSLSLPVKVATAGRVAFEEARAAGERFRAAKFDLQRRVLIAYLDYALTAELARIRRGNVGLLRLISETAENRVQAGGAQQDLLKAGVELRLAENELRTTEAELPRMRAMLNAMLGRDATAPLPPPEALPAPRPLADDDVRLLSLGVSGSPELAALARRVAGRRDALELARLQYLPDVSPAAGLTGGIERFIGAMVMLPTALPAIRGSIREARAMLAATEAMARQTRLDRGAEFVAALYALRNNEREVALLERHVLPASEQVLANTRQQYAAGSVGFVELVDSQRTLLEVRQLIAEARVARERRLAELEALAGTDAEALGPAGDVPPGTAPATRQASARVGPAEAAAMRGPERRADLP